MHRRLLVTFLCVACADQRLHPLRESCDHSAILVSDPSVDVRLINKVLNTTKAAGLNAVSPRALPPQCLLSAPVIRITRDEITLQGKLIATTESVLRDDSPTFKVDALFEGLERVGDLSTGVATGVAAGEWDDNANYRDYLRWLGKARLDVSQRKFLVVTDRTGKPMPNCPITINGKPSLVTMPSGRALLFPRALGLTGPVMVSATCARTSAHAMIGPDAVTTLVLWTDRDVPARRPIDLAFVLDTTGSMDEEIDAVKSTIRTVAEQLASDQLDIRIGLVEYKDREDPEVTRTFPFSSDLVAFSRSVSVLVAGGGGDTPEDMQLGLSTALDKLQWRADAVSRMIVVIADAPPHLDYTDERDYADSARRAAARGIKIFTVSASGMDDDGQIVMRQMAQFTGATNMFVLRGGAGPQSAGGGDPASSCGGTHSNYSSGNLDQLITDKIHQELRSLDADPQLIPGRDQDERAKPCDKRVVMAQ